MLMKMQLHKQATKCKTFQVQTLLGGEGKGVCKDVIYGAYVFTVA